MFLLIPPDRLRHTKHCHDYGQRRQFVASSQICYFKAKIHLRFDKSQLHVLELTFGFRVSRRKRRSTSGQNLVLEVLWGAYATLLGSLQNDKSKRNPTWVSVLRTGVVWDDLSRELGAATRAAAGRGPDAPCKAHSVTFTGDDTV